VQLSLFSEETKPDWDALRRCLRAGAVAIDVETNTRWPGVGPRQDYGLSYAADVTTIGLAWNESGALHTTGLAAPFDERVRAFLVDLFAAANPLIAHNAVFDLRQLSRLTNGRIPARIWDTLAMARLLVPSVEIRYSLVGVARALDVPVPASQTTMKAQRSKMHLVPVGARLRYAQDDARLSYEIYRRQQSLPADATLVDWECRAIYEYCRMAARGIRLNVSYSEDYLVDLHARRRVLVERLYADGLKSPRHSKARAAYLYGTKGVPLPRWPKERRFFTWGGRKRLSETPDAEVTFADLSTNSYVIDTYMEAESPYRDALADLAAFQKVDWLVSTLEGLLEHAAIDGRLHSLVTIGTDTGRRASSNPHMQNWKMPDMAGVAVGDEGFTLVEIDYRNAENIMAALIAGDDALSAACATPDFHSSMAERYFGEAWTAADPDERKQMRLWSKRITYGTNYGMGVPALARSLGVSEDEARQWMHAKDRAFPAVTRTRAEAQSEARRMNRLRLWTGRPIAVPSGFVAWNYLCQGGVSEIVKRAVVVLGEAYRERGMRSRVALDMHDALVIEVAHDEWDAALALGSRVMQTITPPELTDRTTPPIRWQAAPDLTENASKWGAQQWHPSVE